MIWGAATVSLIMENSMFGRERVNHVKLCLQEIDGKALMLLRSDMVMKYMGLKLGPALKLCHHIERLKQGKQ